ncbi:MAG: hypothetical protein ABS808_01740 [Wolbachia endosymbiont of Polyergus mexicanus]|jgi:hypothetical protein|uniref:MotA/TolQ/ExbB proton channel domain-containing protein n=1 Tax=Wolbachia endosymbiont of Polyergus mexicanus TaxID=3171167 RepID=A0AAU7YKW8_9RICK
MTKSQSKGKIKQELSPCPIITGIFYGVVGGMFVGLGGIDDIIAATSFIPSLSPLIAGVIICVGCLGLMAITSYSIFRFCRRSITLSTTRDIVEQAICTGSILE